MFQHIEEPRLVQNAPWVRRLKKRQKAQLRIVSYKPQWIVTHWSETKGTIACEAKRDPVTLAVIDDQQCSGCRNHDRIRPRGFLFVWNFDTKRNEFLELTLTKWTEIKTEADQNNDLRGWRLTIWRGATDNARLQFTLEKCPPEDYGMTFPKEPNVDPSIATLMRK